MSIEKAINGNQSEYKYTGPVTDLTDEQKATFKPFAVETVEDILMMINTSLKENDIETLTAIHDRLMVSDIELAYDCLIVMLRLEGEGKSFSTNGMYMEFVPATTHSKLHSKGIYHRCLNSLPFYIGEGYDNPVLGKEAYPNFGANVLGLRTKKWDRDACDVYREYVSTKYASVIKAILAVR